MKRFLHTSGAERGRGGDEDKAEDEVSFGKAVIHRRKIKRLKTGSVVCVFAARTHTRTH